MPASGVRWISAEAEEVAGLMLQELPPKPRDLGGLQGPVDLWVGVNRRGIG